MGGMKNARLGVFAAAATAAVCASAELAITEICPDTGGFDANGRESGWIELYNDGTETVDLKNYELVRKNIGKALSPGKKKKNLVSRKVAPGEYAIVYTSDEYPNAEDMAGDETVQVYANGMMVYPAKVNPKKFPVVALYKGTDAETKELLQIEYIPVDLCEGYSYAGRVIFKNPTKGAANDVSDTIAYGPNIGPLFGLKHSTSVFDAPARPVAGKDYTVSLPVNPLPSPGFATNEIRSVTLCYHSAFDTAGEKRIAMAKGAFDKKAAGQWWSATIPASDIPAAGQMLRWRAVIEESDGTLWTSPSFQNPDDGFQYLGTVVESPDLEDSHPKMQTFHIFAGGNNLSQMDVDADSQNKSLVPYNARCEIFDAQTGQFYNNVRIDLRGNTSGGFLKKSHGLRFAKCHPLVCTNPFDGEEIETRKTSFIAEYCDPAYIRQSLAFYTFRKAGCHVPFDYPVRLNLNGEFYQLAFHSDRFSDKLIEDHYEPNKVYDEAGDIRAGWLVGYGYKNSGCLHWDGSKLVNWVSCEKKTPDDGNESDLSELTNWVKYFNSGMQANVDNQPAVTRKVVETFDLPAWLNYLAEARITMECDDTWANLSTYYDKYGNGTWMPLGYDMNQSWGHIYYSQYNGTKGQVYADKDDHKAHPFFGGRRVICHYSNGAVSYPGSENWACEAIWQSPKFRRLYLRRLRTLMDIQLMPPGTAKDNTPFWRDYVVAVTNATWECAKLDYARWRTPGAAGKGTFWTDSPTYCWPGALSHADGIEDLWTNYIEPRRRHLFVTHSVTNTSRAVGYAQNLNAGIPLSQSPVPELAAGFSVSEPAEGVLAIWNNNTEAVDMSGWRLRGRVDWTLPAGAVVDRRGVLYVAADRAAYVASLADNLADQVIVGNAFFTSVEGVRLESAAGEEVFNSLVPEITSVSEDIVRGTASIAVDVSQIAAAYGVADPADVSITVAPAGTGRSYTAGVADDWTAVVVWQNPRKNVVREVEITVSIQGSGSVAEMESVEIVSAWRWYFRATEEAGGSWSSTGKTAVSIENGAVSIATDMENDDDISGSSATFTLSSPGESAGKVVVVEMDAAWETMNADALENIDTGDAPKSGLVRLPDGFYAYIDGSWQHLDANPGIDTESVVRTIVEVNLASREVAYYIVSDGVASLLCRHAMSAGASSQFESLEISGNAFLSKLDGKILSRNGTETTGFILRVR